MLERITGRSLLKNAGVENEIEFWQKYSNIVDGTSYDHMVQVLTEEGYSGTPADMLNAWLGTVTVCGGTMRDKALELFNDPLLVDALFSIYQIVYDDAGGDTLIYEDDDALLYDNSNNLIYNPDENIIYDDDDNIIYCR